LLGGDRKLRYSDHGFWLQKTLLVGDTELMTMKFDLPLGGDKSYHLNEVTLSKQELLKVLPNAIDPHISGPQFGVSQD
jgi:hypothetical protein